MTPLVKSIDNKEECDGKEKMVGSEVRKKVDGGRCREDIAKR